MDETFIFIWLQLFSVHSELESHHEDETLFQVENRFE